MAQELVTKALCYLLACIPVPRHGVLRSLRNNFFENSETRQFDWVSFFGPR